MLLFVLIIEAQNLGSADVAAERDLSFAQWGIDLDDEHVLGLVQSANRVALVDAAEADASASDPATDQFTSLTID